MLAGLAPRRQPNCNRRMLVGCTGIGSARVAIVAAVVIVSRPFAYHELIADCSKTRTPFVAGTYDEYPVPDGASSAQQSGYGSAKTAARSPWDKYIN